MKKTIILFIVSIFIISCDDFLELTPKDFISPVNYYSNLTDLNRSISTVYSSGLGMYTRYLSEQLPNCTDEGFYKISNPDLRVYNYDAGNSDLGWIWTSLYKGVDRANEFIENVDRADCSDSIKMNLKGEALFLRAYYHFVIATYWGSVPMHLESSKDPKILNVPRTPEPELYAQIVKDMEQAEGMVADINKFNYSEKISKSAVQGILARVCLFAAGRTSDRSYYEKARNWSLKVIQSGKHALNPSYQNIFVNLMQDKYDVKESIFEVGFWGSTYDSNYKCNAFASGLAARTSFPASNTLNYIGTPGQYGQGNFLSVGSGLHFGTSYLYDKYEAGDLRRDWTLQPYTYKSYNTLTVVPEKPTYKFRFIGKFRREYEINFPLYKWGNSTNWPLLRYSDVLLMFAEADNEVNGGPQPEAIEYVNMVRRRAFGVDPSIKNPTIDKIFTSKDDFFVYLKDERMRELAFEAIRKMDLSRWGIFYDQMKSVKTIIENTPATDLVGAQSYFPGITFAVAPYANFDKRNALCPIPTAEMTVNKALNGENNPGW
jgi:hypothetical protein